MSFAGSLYKYAVGRIVLWAPTGSQVDVGKGLDALRDRSIQKIAIAIPSMLHMVALPSRPWNISRCMRQ